MKVDNSVFLKKKIMLGVTGSIAAYKSAQLCSNLLKLGADVTVVMTPNATSFINPVTFSAISGKKAIVNLFENESKIYHISLAHSIDIALVAPATANTISKLAYGICDNFLTTVVVSANCPVLISPAMNESMYLNPIIQENIQKMQKSGKFFFILPKKGRLACGEEGFGKMEDEDIIIERLAEFLSYSSDLAGKRVIITAGGTKEDIDAVRYISNYSSGRMGYALAEEAYFRGAQRVILISTNRNLPVPYGVEIKYVQSSSEMKDRILEHFFDSDITIMAAAVSDIIPVEKFEYKLKKEDDIVSKLKFKLNENILRILAEHKRKGQFLVGFSAESGENIKNAFAKIKSTNIDMIIANDISRDDIGMMSEFNEVSIIKQNGDIKRLARDRKRIIARGIWDEIIKNIKIEGAG